MFDNFFARPNPSGSATRYSRTVRRWRPGLSTGGYGDDPLSILESAARERDASSLRQAAYVLQDSGYVRAGNHEPLDLVELEVSERHGSDNAARGFWVDITIVSRSPIAKIRVS